MADTLNNKPKVQLGSGFVKNGAVSPVTPTKLLINHGKPNFTIQRSPKIDEQRKFPPVQTLKNNNNINTENNEHVVLSNTKFFGVLNNVNNVAQEKSAEMSEPLENGNVHKVALRRTPTLPATTKPNQDDNVPEFILRQRAIQERLARENVLDFDKRRSGYFTHVVISPTSPSPTSFAETMSSPRVNPALEIPPPQTKIETQIKSEPVVVEKPQEELVVENHKETQVVDTVEPEVQAVIHKVESDVIEETQKVEADQVESHKVESKVGVESHKVESEVGVESHKVEVDEQVESHKDTDQVDDEEVANAIEEVNKAIAGEDMQAEDEQHIDEIEQDTHSVHIEAKVEIIEEKPLENDYKIDENNNAGESITISHTNGLDTPHLPSPDPSGVLGVNYEPKTVVSFSKDLSSGENKYPDTVKIEVNGQQVADPELAELSKLKFDIKTDDNDIQVVPTIKSE